MTRLICLCTDHKLRFGAGIDDPKESLQDEITRVVTTLAQNKVRLEKHELTVKKRFCTIGLHGPWGQSSTVFVFRRITFTFLKEYPHRVDRATGSSYRCTRHLLTENIFLTLFSFALPTTMILNDESPIGRVFVAGQSEDLRSVQSSGCIC
ncbi:hypothetical protein BDZ89DRAFT_1076166 [Hymenopellis radicata]|nr:hypothetical protein BDZ89DRAFT_1076166 [Hymenopellis radicata]